MGFRATISMSEIFDHSRSLVSSHHLCPQFLCRIASLNLLTLMHTLPLTSSEHPLPLANYLFARQTHLETASPIYHGVLVSPIVLCDCHHLPIVYRCSLSIMIYRLLAGALCA